MKEKNKKTVADPNGVTGKEMVKRLQVVICF